MVLLALQGILEDTVYHLQASGIYTKLAVDVLNAPSEIPLSSVHVNQECNLTSFKSK
jgi:hypothetical protein